ncbi:MAG: hypothetical protein AAF517_28600, partial [Planctomycetota bacterium]
MAAYRVPVLIWRDLSGFYSARWVEDTEERAAVSEVRERAIKELRAYLKWYFENDPWARAPDFFDARVLWIGVTVQSEYRFDDRTYPSSAIRLRVPCVLGTREHGLLVCSIPTLSIQFDYHDETSLKSLAEHYVQKE